MELNQLLQNILVATVLAVLPIVTQALTKYLKGLSNDKYVNYATDVIISVVTAVSQKTVENLKKSGKFNIAAQKAVFEDAKRQILSMLNEKSKQVLKELYGDLDKWVETQIESTVKEIKSGA